MSRRPFASRALVVSVVATTLTLVALVAPVGATAAATTGAGGQTVRPSTYASPQKPSVKPKITSMAPTSAPVGTTVTFTGSGFTAPASVSFNGTAATGTVVSATSITAPVPSGATTGAVAVTTAGTTLKPGTFTVVVPLALSLSTVTGPPTTVVTIIGSGFAANEPVDLYAGTTDVALVAASGAGSFSYPGFTIPASAQPGGFTITAIGRRSGLAAQTSFTVAANWPQLGDGATHRGVNTYENTLNSSNVGGIDQAWSYTTANYVKSTPAVVNGVLYVGSSDDNVYALNATTGTKIWNYATAGPVTTAPAVVNGIVYIGSGDHSVYALNATTGAKIWSYTTGAAIYSSPAVVNGIVYIGSSDDNVYALNATTGTKIWSYTTGGNVSSPAVSNGVLYVGSSDDNVYALNATTGTKLWSYGTGAGIYGTPTVSQGYVYVGSLDDKVYALEARSGSLLWSVTTGSSVYGSSCVLNGTVYIPSYDGNLYALNGSTGVLKWDIAIGAGDDTPVAANGLLYVGRAVSGAGAVSAIDPSSGQIYATVSTGIADPISPIVVNGFLYTGSFYNTVVAYDLAGGSTPSAAHRINPATLHPNMSLTLG